MPLVFVSLEGFRT